MPSVLSSQQVAHGRAPGPQLVLAEDDREPGPTPIGSAEECLETSSGGFKPHRQTLLAEPRRQGECRTHRTLFERQDDGSLAEGEASPALVRFCQAVLNLNEFVYVE